ncbi:MAG: M24 family metallopeptidase [Calditrichaeota bacterium]|nr:M24 family metallopeptidase [Calditrichota bacterium]
MQVPNSFQKTVFQSRRETFLSRLDPPGVVILASRPKAIRNLDTPYPYRQDSNFYYLTGLELPDSIAVMDAESSRKRFILYIPRQNTRARLYEGPLPDPEQIKATFGADQVLYTDQFSSSIGRFVKKDRPIYYTFGIHRQLDEQILQLFHQRRSGGLWPILDPFPILARMRLIKSEVDFQMGFQKAIDITIRAIKETLPAIRPGMFEYEVQALIEYHFRRQGSPRNGFDSIIASGPNCGILHYVENHRQLQEGDLLLIDCGAEFHYYTADITRTVPVSGTFQPAQRQIYDIVLQAQQLAIDHIQPGKTRKQVEQVVNDFMAQALLDLGLIRRKKDYKHYTIHGYTHWLGMDVHDVGGYAQDGRPLRYQPGMVMTVEPGIYIREDVLERLRKAGNTAGDLAAIERRIGDFLNIGVRIEDDVRVTRDGCEVLTDDLPRTADAIEALMRGK